MRHRNVKCVLCANASNWKSFETSIFLFWIDMMIHNERTPNKRILNNTKDNIQIAIHFILSAHADEYMLYRVCCTMYNNYNSSKQQPVSSWFLCWHITWELKSNRINRYTAVLITIAQSIFVRSLLCWCKCLWINWHKSKGRKDEKKQS